jgi:hypothetical protein
VQYPILPVIQKHPDGLRLFKRNTKLATPRDFDYSPYFEIIKYPILGLNDLSVYRSLPWDQEGVICNDETDCFIPNPNTKPVPFDMKTPYKKLPNKKTKTASDSSASGSDIDDANFNQSS